MDEYSAIQQKRCYSGTIENYFRMLKDCEQLINFTKKPDVFFPRYLMSIAILNDLILIEKKLNFVSQKPSQIKRQLQQKEIDTVNDFINRYYDDTIQKINSLKTTKAQNTRIENFCSGLNNYKQYLTKTSLDKYNQLCLELQKQIK